MSLNKPTDINIDFPNLTQLANNVADIKAALGGISDLSQITEKIEELSVKIQNINFPKNDFYTAQSLLSLNTQGLIPNNMAFPIYIPNLRTLVTDNTVIINNNFGITRGSTDLTNRINKEGYKVLKHECKILKFSHNGISNKDVQAGIVFLDANENLDSTNVVLKNAEYVRNNTNNISFNINNSTIITNASGITFTLIDNMKIHPYYDSPMLDNDSVNIIILINTIFQKIT